MMAGMSTAQSSEGMIQMVKKREKMNNSAMSTQSKPVSSGTNVQQQIDGQQFMAQLSKLYSSKRTPTANGVIVAGGNSRDSQTIQGATAGN